MAAGLGFKTFTTGEVLTAADTNGYLMQGILVFASSAARASAVTSPQEGQYSFLKDTNALEYYDGAAWVGAPVGDITAVTAGKGLTGGGSSGDVTVSLGTAAKGDLVAGTGTTTAAALTFGANNTVLTADSSTATGLKWATPSSSLPALVGVSCSRDATTSLTAGVIAYLPFTTEVWDTNTFHDNSTNTSRITIPSGYGGKYLFTGFIGIGGVGSNSFDILMLKNGASNPVPGGRIVLMPNNAGNTAADSWGIMLELVATDYIEVGLRVATTSASYSVQALFQATYLGA